MNLEILLLGNMAFNETYTRKVLPFVKTEYFSNKEEQVVHDLITSFIKKYNTMPSKEALYIDLSNKEDLNESLFKQTKDLLDKLDTNYDNKNLDWLLDQTETFCKDKALYNAIKKSIEVINNKEEHISRGALPKLLSDALGVSFDTHIGHDFLEDSEQRYIYYNKEENKIPFDLEMLNKVTHGGLPDKTLNVILAGPNVGKSMMMCHMAAHHLVIGKNVLYITLEMAEEEIAKRIDTNLLNIPINELKGFDKSLYDKKVNRVKSRTTGQLIIKEYPTTSAGSANFRHLLNELKLKKNFVPDIIYVDYLNICISSRLKNNNNVNSYTFIKSIAEELRGLAAEFGVPIMTATQTTRGGFTNSNPGLEDVAESFGVPAVADFMIALVSSDELEELGQILVIQLKNRYGNKNYYNKFVIGVDRDYMKFYNVEQSAQDGIIDDKSVMDNSKSGERMSSEKVNKKDFIGFK